MNLEKNFNLDAIDDIARLILETIKTKTLLFYGEMGVGKTTLINALVNALGGQVKATSPTFSIVNEYEVENDLVYHFDFYRIEKVEEVLDLGIEDYLYSGCWNFIEWPDKIDVFLPKEVDILYIKQQKNGSRTVKLTVLEVKNLKK